MHSWDTMEKQNRCFVCSGENHFAKDCPTKKPKDSKRVAKIKGSPGVKEVGLKESEGVEESKKEDEVTTTTSKPSQGSLKSSSASGSREVVNPE